MKSKFLFPTWCRIVGYILAIPGFILGHLSVFNNYEIPGFGFRMREHDSFFESAFENFTNELAIFLVVIGLIFIAFSKSKKEDELSAKLRLDSLYWSVMIYYIIYFVGFMITIFVGELPFIGDHIKEINIFSPLLIFICRYYYLKYVDRESYLVSEPKFLSNKPFKQIGMILTLLSIAAFIVVAALNFKGGDGLTQAIALTFIFGALIWAFSKNRTEDEMTKQSRMESLQLAVYFNYFTLLLATLLFYSIDYLFVLVFAQISLLLFFIIRMEYVNYKNNQLLKNLEGELSHEK